MVEKNTIAASSKREREEEEEDLFGGICLLMSIYIHIFIVPYFYFMS